MGCFVPLRFTPRPFKGGGEAIHQYPRADSRSDGFSYFVWLQPLPLLLSASVTTATQCQCHYCYSVSVPLLLLSGRVSVSVITATQCQRHLPTLVPGSPGIFAAESIAGDGKLTASWSSPLNPSTTG